MTGARLRVNPAVSERSCSPEAGCITCGDVAVELDVLLVDEQRGLALCRDDEDRRETVEIALVGAGRDRRPAAGPRRHRDRAPRRRGATGTLGREAEEVPA